MSGTSLMKILGGEIDQLGFVVPDLDKAVDAHADLGPWQIYEYDSTFVPNLSAHGEPAEFAMRIGLCNLRPQLEIIQPLDDHSPYAEWLNRPGNEGGVHHLGFVVDDRESVRAEMVGAGFDPFLEGSGHGADGSGWFCYFETTGALGYIAEAIQPPALRRDPIEVRHA